MDNWSNGLFPEERSSDVRGRGGPKLDIYEKLGVRTIINARGTISYLGGSIPHPQVMEAMVEASQSFVNTYELQRAVGKRLAELTHNEAAFVSVSAAAGLLLAAAAVMAGKDEAKRAQLPNTEGMKSEAIALAVNKNPYHHCVKPAGMSVKWVGDPEHPTPEEVEQSIGPDTACCLYFINRELEGKQLPLDVMVEICHRHGVPVIVDAAAQFPPFENTWKFTRDMGADVAVFSGGKGFRGPQSSGLVVGTEDMIDKIMFFCPPIHSVARPAKASRELIVGLLTTIELMSETTADEFFGEYEARLDTIFRGLQDIPGLSIYKRFGTDVGKPFHHIRATIDKDVAGFDSQHLFEALDSGIPRIAVGELPNDELLINAEMLRPGEEVLVINRIQEIFGGSA
jgi:D-glucosaminate-6-phosphate ammonia-lyase